MCLNAKKFEYVFIEQSPNLAGVCYFGRGWSNDMPDMQQQKDRRQLIGAEPIKCDQECHGECGLVTWSLQPPVLKKQKWLSSQLGSSYRHFLKPCIIQSRGYRDSDCHSHQFSIHLHEKSTKLFRSWSCKYKYHIRQKKSLLLKLGPNSHALARTVRTWSQRQTSAWRARG